jgi:hypothetical protein
VADTQGPGQPTPQDLARIQANVATMRAKGASEDEVKQYLQHEDSLLTAAPSESTNASAPADPTEINAGNLARSALYGGTMHFGDELGVVDPKKQAAFSAKHPFADFLAQVVGGSVAPALLTAAMPELATAGGVAAMSGATGAAEGVGSGTDAKSRLEGGAVGGALGTVGGVAMHGATEALGGAVSKLLQRIRPGAAAEAAAGTAGESLLSAGEAQRATARMAQVNSIVPGGSSPLTASVPEMGMKSSRFEHIMRGIGANPDAAAQTEAQLVQQAKRLQAGRVALGQRMDALDGDLPVTTELRGALSKAKPILGGKAPNVGADDEVDLNPLGVEKAQPFSFDPEAKTIKLQDARDALGRLRYMARQASRRGVDANGITAHDIHEAIDALQSVVYDHAPGLQPLDQQYSVLSNELRQVNRVIPVVQRSRSNYAANKMLGIAPGSAGASLPMSPKGVGMAAIDALISGDKRSAAADATRAMIARPGASVQGLLDAAPGMPRVAPAVKAGIATSLPTALKGLLFPQDDER